MLSPTGEIRRDEGCLDYAGGIKDANNDDTVLILQCHGQKGNQDWVYNEVCFLYFLAKFHKKKLSIVFFVKNNQIYHPYSKLCMALSDDMKHIQMQTCDLNNRHHRWSWKRKQ